MDAPDKKTSLAARIADGSDIDWAAAQSATSSPDDRALMEELRAIAGIATAHRAPSAWSGQDEVATKTWGPLTILQPLGTGRFGDVYLAWDARLQRRVALKILRVASSSLASPTRAIDEARLLARVRHPNVLTVYGAEYLDDQVGIWTEFIEGRTLAAELAERGPLAPDEVIEIGIDLCRALAAVHDAGLLHRDVKAQNVMRDTGGRIVLMDFGAGHDLELAPVRDGDLTGTPLYLAPEVLAGGAASPASDVYALGVLLFHLLTGTHPVTGRTLEDVRGAHERGRIQSLLGLRADVPSRLADALERGTGRDPQQRFGSAHDFEKALLSSRPVVPAPGAPATGSEGGTARRHRGLIAAVLGLVVVAGAVSWVVLGGRPDAATPTSALAASSRPDLSPTLLPGFLSLTGIGSVSPDGRFVSQFEAGGLVIRDLLTLTETRIAAAPDGQAGRVFWPRFSRDSKRIAYLWSPAGGGWRLGVVDVSSKAGVKPQWYVDDPQTAVSMVHDWSGDGRVLVDLVTAGGRYRLAMMSTTDGSISTVLEHELAKLQIHPRARLSPDDRYVAYAARTRNGDPRDGLPVHLYIRAADGSREEAVVTTAAENLNPVWSPDGTRLFYTSDVSGTVDLWSIPVRNGRPNGQPQRVRADVGPGPAIDITATGFYYHLRRRDRLGQIFVGDVPDDLNTQIAMYVAAPFVGRHPKWSPDGRSLGLLRGSKVIVVTLPDRSEADIGSSLRPLLWLNPRTVITQSEEDRDRPVPRVIDVLTRQATAGGALPPRLLRSAAAAVSPDGRTLYAAAGDLVTEAGRRVETAWNRLVAIDLFTGETRVVWQFPDDLVALPWGWLTGIALSPDGRVLAVAVCPIGASETRLFRVGVDGTGYRDLYRAYVTSGAYGKVAWSARGIYIGEVVTPRGPEASWRIMLVNPDTGDARALMRFNGRDDDAAFDPSPDGSRIALNPGPLHYLPPGVRAGPRDELWRFDLRAFLPSPPPGSQK